MKRSADQVSGAVHLSSDLTVAWPVSARAWYAGSMRTGSGVCDCDRRSDEQELHIVLTLTKQGSSSAEAGIGIEAGGNISLIERVPVAIESHQAPRGMGGFHHITARKGTEIVVNMVITRQSDGAKRGKAALAYIWSALFERLALRGGTYGRPVLREPGPAHFRREGDAHAVTSIVDRASS